MSITLGLLFFINIAFSQEGYKILIKGNLNDEMQEVVILSNELESLNFEKVIENDFVIEVEKSNQLEFQRHLSENTLNKDEKSQIKVISKELNENNFLIAYEMMLPDKSCFYFERGLFKHNYFVRVYFFDCEPDLPLDIILEMKNLKIEIVED